MFYLSIVEIFCISIKFFSSVLMLMCSFYFYEILMLVLNNFVVHMFDNPAASLFSERVTYCVHSAESSSQ